MAFSLFYLVTVLVAINAPLQSWAADCDSKQTRSDSDPSGTAIGQVIRANDLLTNICSKGFPPGSNTIATFNTGTITFNITRADPSKAIQNCTAAFDNIISQCIEDGNYWGGKYTLTGLLYSIYDSDYPNVILPSLRATSKSVSNTKSDTASNTKSSTASNTKSNPASITGSSTRSSVQVAAGATTITTVFSGNTITETLVPVTVSGKSSTTSTTEIGGIIFPLIIGAGGLAFIPFIPAGGAIPPPITPPGVPDDGGPGQTVEPPTITPTIQKTQTTGSPSSLKSSSISSSISSSSSSRLTFTPSEEYYGGGPGSFNKAIATQTTTYGKGASTASVSSTNSLSSKPASSTSSIVSSSAPTPTVDPNKPNPLKCYGAGTPNSLFSFDGGAANTPISTFCNSWIGDYTYSSFKVGATNFYPIDGKAWYESSQLLQISGIVTDYNQAKADTDDQKAATIASCIKGLTNIIWYCDYGSGTKWGGVGTLNGQILGIAGDTGTTTIPLGL